MGEGYKLTEDCFEGLLSFVADAMISAQTLKSGIYEKIT
jgi:hypothetical protein